MSNSGRVYRRGRMVLQLTTHRADLEYRKKLRMQYPEFNGLYLVFKDTDKLEMR